MNIDNSLVFSSPTDVVGKLAWFCRRDVLVLASRTGGCFAGGETPAARATSFKLLSHPRRNSKSAPQHYRERYET